MLSAWTTSCGARPLPASFVAVSSDVQSFAVTASGVVYVLNEDHGPARSITGMGGSF